MPQKLITAAAWGCLAFIGFATLCSIGARPELVANGIYKGFFTVFERFAAYALLGLLFSLAYPQNITLVCIVVFGSAVTLELLQNFFPDRDARLLDVLEKLMGGAAGIVLGEIVRFGRSENAASRRANNRTKASE